MSQGPIDTRLEEALDVLKAARPYVESQTRLTATTGPGLVFDPARDVLARIDACLEQGWPEPAPLPPDYWETAT